jgi:hypothetical protein
MLNISNCPLERSLMPLERLTGLKVLNITNTNISDGLEYLPDSCEKIYCNSDYGYKSLKIVKELEKYDSCSEEERDNNGNIIDKYYNLRK